MQGRLAVLSKLLLQYGKLHEYFFCGQFIFFHFFFLQNFIRRARKAYFVFTYEACPAVLYKTLCPLWVGRFIFISLVGKGFEQKMVFLPQLLMSAEAAKQAFESIKTYLLANGTTQAKRSKFVLATVKGDIHDIGKNIVKVLLENYGFEVVDLGKDVPPEKVIESVVEHRAPIVGLSALMTTTVASMADTVKLLRENAPWCKIVVGGAVMTQEYADKIGADKYAKDAMETVRYAEEVERK